MSALGQKQTCALQNVMSALLPIATTKADFLKHHVRFGPKADILDSFDHFVGADE